MTGSVFEAAQPCLLELLVAPQRDQRRPPILRNVSAARGGGGEVEQRAIGVEDADADALQESQLLGRVAGAWVTS
jgi:hypothetical protein